MAPIGGWHTHGLIDAGQARHGVDAAGRHSELIPFDRQQVKLFKPCELFDHEVRPLNLPALPDRLIRLLEDLFDLTITDPPVIPTELHPLRSGYALAYELHQLIDPLLLDNGIGIAAHSLVQGVLSGPLSPFR